MSDLGIKVGDKIRVTYVHEGVVDEITVTDGISYGDGDYYFRPEEANERGVTIEILERAKPKWQHGDVALEGDCKVPFVYDGVRNGFYWPSGIRNFGDYDTFKLIVRDGKPV